LAARELAGPTVGELLEPEFLKNCSRAIAATRAPAAEGLAQPWFEMIFVPLRRQEASTACMRSSRYVS